MFNTTIKFLIPLLTSMMVSLLYSGGIIGQTRITLQDAISKVKESNKSILIAKKSVEVQEAMLDQSKARFLPYIGANATAISTNNPLNVFGSKLLQESVTQADFNPVLLNDPDELTNFNLAINGMIPLIDPESWSEHKAAKSQVAMKMTMAQRTTEFIEMETTKSYYMLLLTDKSIHVHEEVLAAALSNYAVAENYFEQGLMLKSDLLDLKIMVNQSELSLGTAQTAKAQAQSNFNLLLGSNGAVEYIPTDELMEVADLQIKTGACNPDRSDLLAMQHGIEALNTISKAANRAYYPKLNAFGSYEFNDEEPFDNTAENYQVGVQLKWDLFQGNNRRSNHKKTKAVYEEKVLEFDKIKAEANAEIDQVKREIVDLKSQMALHELSISQAEEALEIRRNRFSQGLEKSNDIINSETQMAQRRLARLNSLFELNMKNAYLDLLLK